VGIIARSRQPAVELAAEHGAEPWVDEAVHDVQLGQLKIGIAGCGADQGDHGPIQVVNHVVVEPLSVDLQPGDPLVLLDEPVGVHQPGVEELAVLAR
jgi:hypothetical protein